MMLTEDEVLTPPSMLERVKKFGYSLFSHTLLGLIIFFVLFLAYLWLIRGSNYTLLDFFLNFGLLVLLCSAIIGVVSYMSMDSLWQKPRPKNSKAILVSGVLAFSVVFPMVSIYLQILFWNITSFEGAYMISFSSIPLLILVGFFSHRVTEWVFSHFSLAILSHFDLETSPDLVSLILSYCGIGSVVSLVSYPIGYSYFLTSSRYIFSYLPIFCVLYVGASFFVGLLCRLAMDILWGEELPHNFKAEMVSGFLIFTVSFALVLVNFLILYLYSPFPLLLLPTIGVVVISGFVTRWIVNRVYSIYVFGSITSGIEIQQGEPN